jgi:hypothetical protein
MRVGPRGTRRSAACAVSEHAACPHLMGFRIVGEELCQCPCHDGCPCSGTASAALGEWWDSCTCPGSGRMREQGRSRWNRDRPPDLEDIRRAGQAEDEAWDEVRAAVLARSAGRSGAEVRQLLIAELQSRNRPVPEDPILDGRVEQIMSIPPPLPPDASAFTALKMAVRMMRHSRAVHKSFAAMDGAVQRLEGPQGQPPYLVEADYSLPLVDVILAPGAAAILDSVGDGIVVSLERDLAGGDPAPVAVYSQGNRVGTLGTVEGALYQAALDAAQRAGGSLMVHGKIGGSPGRARKLQVYPAGIM